MRLFRNPKTASLAVTPVLWPHTMALLLVAIAVLSPRLGWLWFTPLLLWVGEAIGGGKAAGSVCCRPEGTSEFAWATMSGSSALAPSLAAAILLGSVLVAVVLEDDRVRLGVGL